MKKRKLNSKLFLNKERISNLNLSEINGNGVPTEGVPTEYENLSQMLTYEQGASGNHCAEVCWQQGTYGNCTDEMNTCTCP